MVARGRSNAPSTSRVCASHFALLRLQNVRQVLHFFIQNARLDAFDFMPGFEVLNAADDCRFVSAVALLDDDEGCPRRRFSGFPIEHDRLGRLTQGDENEPGVLSTCPAVFMAVTAFSSSLSESGSSGSLDGTAALQKCQQTSPPLSLLDHFFSAPHSVYPLQP